MTVPFVWSQVGYHIVIAHVTEHSVAGCGYCTVHLVGCSIAYNIKHCVLTCNL